MLGDKNKPSVNCRAVFNKITGIAIIIFALVDLTSCSITNNTTSAKGIAKSAATQYIPRELQAWNEKQKIKLLPHQLIPIDYLEKNRNIKGLLLYHYLGTGKTYAALGYCKRHPAQKVIIFAPSFLQSHWLEHIKAYGIYDQKRYEFISHKNPHKLANANLTNTIVIIDESARFIEKILVNNTEIDLYTKVYLNIQKANRVLSLTGTPIYSDVTNLAYQINLVSSSDLLSFNKEHFKAQFTKIKKTRSFFRGYFLESMMAPPVTAVTATGIGLAFTTYPPLIMGSLFAGYFLPDLLKMMYPLEKYPLREYNLALLKQFGEKYISYYNFDLSNKEHYPTSSIKYRDVEYNKPQLAFLLRFFDSRLKTDELLQLLKDEDSKKYSRKYVSFNSNILQRSLKSKPGGGEQIGNLLFAEKQNQNKIIYPNKFYKILDLLRETKGSAVMYSYYYHNGILLFTKFLDRHGYKNWYKILTPNLSVKEHAKIISDYNSGKIKLLLLHPDITEGISLKGTQQLHLLETPYNRSFQEQIIGRTIRYRSHTHLPENMRHVRVYVWKQILPTYGLANNIALRENWHQNFSEINYYSGGGKGRLQIDPNASLKNISPDERAYIHQNNLAVSTKKLREHLTQFSIENHYARKK